MGMPLFDTDGRTLGHLAILDDEVAAAELGRQRRDRELREREEKLSRLVETAMDALLELDADLGVTRMNESGERVL